MKKFLILAFFLAALTAGGEVFAQVDDATQPAPPAPSPETKIRVGNVRLTPDAIFLEVNLIREDGSFSRTEAEIITNGDSGNPADNYFTGSGTGGEPVGLLLAITGRAYCTGSTPSPTCAAGVDPAETGGTKRRTNRRICGWLKAHLSRYAGITVL